MLLYTVPVRFVYLWYLCKLIREYGNKFLNSTVGQTAKIVEYDVCPNSKCTYYTNYKLRYMINGLLQRFGSTVALVIHKVIYDLSFVHYFH